MQVFSGEGTNANSINELMYLATGVKVVKNDWISEWGFNKLGLDRTKLPAGASPDYMYFMFDPMYVRENEILVVADAEGPSFRSYTEPKTETMSVLSKARSGAGHFGIGSGIFAGYKGAV
jgi:hypothetical protein